MDRNLNGVNLSWNDPRDLTSSPKCYHDNLTFHGNIDNHRTFYSYLDIYNYVSNYVDNNVNPDFDYNAARNLYDNTSSIYYSYDNSNLSSAFW